METTVHRVLGLERIRQICAENGLDDEGCQMVDRILEEWEGLVGRPMAKAEAGIRIVGNNPRRREIVATIVKISAEFSLVQQHKN
jgi:hypothetical protein